MNDVIVKYLQDKGYHPYTGFYKTINSWIDLWKGKTEFHKYQVEYNGQIDEKEMYSLGMPKRIAEDWASICWTEKDTIVTSDNNQKYLDSKLRELKLNKQLPLSIEKSAYSGTCGAILRIKNAKLVGKKIKTDKFTKYDLVLMSANQIIPLRVECGNIIDCAFISELVEKGKKIYYIEIHELKKRSKNNEEYESYRIKNIYIDEDGNEVEQANVLKEYYIESDIPLFSILKPPIDNPYQEANGLGMAVYSNAIDQVYSVDIAYHNFVMDYFLGGKKVFYNKRLTGSDKNGNPIYPDDISKQQFKIIGDEMENINDKALIYEYNPDLRVEDNTNGLQLSLNLLSFKSMLGTDFYQFLSNSAKVVTATQYLGDRQDLTIHARKYRENVDEFIENICRGILLLGRILFKQKVNENDKIEVVNSDGFLVSEEDLKQQYIDEISAGLRQPWEYRVKFFGEDEETAKAMIEDKQLKKNEDDDSGEDEE